MESDFDSFGSGFLSVALTEEQETEAQELYRVSFLIFKDPDALKTLSLNKTTKKKVRSYLNHVRLGEDGSRIIVTHVREEYVLSKFEDRERIIKDTRCNRHFPMIPTLEMIQRTYWWQFMYKQVQSLLQKCNFCQRYAKQVKLLEECRGNPPPQRLPGDQFELIF